MGILAQNMSYLSLIRKEIYNSNKEVFVSDQILPVIDSNDPKVSFRLSLNGVELDFIEESSNIVLIGVPIKDIKIIGFESPTLEYKVSDLKLFIRPDFKSTNKSDTHMILFRFLFSKHTIEALFDTTTSTVKRYTVGDIYSFSKIKNTLILNKKSFPFSRYLNASINGKLILLN
jgi:hypothetical protein